MRKLMIKALNDAYIKVVRSVPHTKMQATSISIQDVRPLDITDFMLRNDIPDDATFGGNDNGYDAWDDICLCWDIIVPTTDKDKLEFKRKRFSSDVAFRKVYNLLLANGYKRIGSNSALFKEFDDTTVYDMYVNKDIDRLEKYYSLFFNKI